MIIQKHKCDSSGIETRVKIQRYGTSKKEQNKQTTIYYTSYIAHNLRYKSNSKVKSTRV